MLQVGIAAVPLLVINRKDQFAVVGGGEDPVVVADRGAGDQCIAVEAEHLVAGIHGVLPAAGVQGSPGFHGKGRTPGDPPGVGAAPAVGQRGRRLVVFAEDEIPAVRLAGPFFCPLFRPVDLLFVDAEYDSSVPQDQFLVGKGPEEADFSDTYVEHGLFQVVGISFMDIGEDFVHAPDMGVESPVGPEIALGGYHVVLIEEAVDGPASRVVPRLLDKVGHAVVENVA